MSFEWQTITIAELGRVVTGKTPPTAKPQFWGNEYPFITPTDISSQRYCVPSRQLSEEGRASQPKLLLPDRAVCVTCIASVGKMCLTDRPSFTNQQINSVIVDESLFDPFFVFYLLQNQVDRLKAVAGGVATPIINKTAFSEIKVSVPPLPAQKRIAGILSAYDELIENSQQRIKVLETMARNLYREWFVHYRYPGHENTPRIPSPLGDIPKGWEVKNVKDVAMVTYGFPFKSKEFNADGNGTPVIRIRDIPEGCSATFTKEDSDPKFHIKNGHILIGMDGDFHMCIWSNGHAFQNQRVARFESNGVISNYHLFLALEKPIQDFNKAIVGTTVAHLGDMHIKTIQIAWPTEAIVYKAAGILEPISEQIIALKRQIQNLRKTRDLLLPRLLSGQIPLHTPATQAA